MLNVSGGGKGASGKGAVMVGKRDKATKLHHGRATIRPTKLEPGTKKYAGIFRGSTTIGPGTRSGRVAVGR